MVGSQNGSRKRNRAPPCSGSARFDWWAVKDSTLGPAEQESGPAPRHGHAWRRILAVIAPPPRSRAVDRSGPCGSSPAPAAAAPA
jgi:hypothetical protein